MTTDFYNHLYNRCKQAPEGLGVVDYDNEMFVRYIYNFSGQIVGYQRYNWKAGKTKSNAAEGRYFTWLTKYDGKHSALGLLGVETIKYGDTLYFVEGQFEQATADAYDLNCVAVLCNNPKQLKSWIRAYPGKTVALCQNDAAGMKLKNLTSDFIVLPKDLDEMTKEEVLKLIEEETTC